MVGVYRSTLTSASARQNSTAPPHNTTLDRVS